MIDVEQFNVDLYRWFLVNHPELRVSILHKDTYKKGTVEIHAFCTPNDVEFLDMNGNRAPTVRVDCEYAQDVIDDIGCDGVGLLIYKMYSEQVERWIDGEAFGGISKAKSIPPRYL